MAVTGTGIGTEIETDGAAEEDAGEEDFHGKHVK